MASFYVWSTFIIFYQTCLYVIFSWLTLQCKLVPRSTEPHELTLIKMLYFYEPEICGRVYYYNYTIQTPRKNISLMRALSSNAVAASFRMKMKLSMSLHMVWFGLTLLNASQGRRPCGFYAILLPLTVTGIAVLVVDLLHAAMFLKDSTLTRTEAQIWGYIGHDEKNTVQFENIIPIDLPDTSDIKAEDTSWVAMLFAYISIRGVVQWIVNFWIIKDTYFDGLRYYRELNVRGTEKKRNLY